MAPFLRRRKTIHEVRTKRRIYTIVPWIQNPLQGVDKERLVFAPRQEASTLELFFDLFFVANLTTFTTYHSIVDHSSLFSYIGFFAIIWVTWFHTVLYDVRFENDSIYSRACKVVIMIVFVGFALVGSSFAPGTDQGDNTNFRILCYTLVLSRLLFIIQYVVVGVFVGLASRHDLFLPLFLNVLTYAIAAGAYAAMISAFTEDKPVAIETGIYSVWWVIMVLETVATITISSFWRMLSFKKTHLVERMGLLTLIVIGEGAIGATKTISRLMGKSGLDPEGSGLVLCIVMILVGIWMIYFDNHPHGHFGTIKQQIWSVLHFPIHLAIVGLAEGAQQVALARHIARGMLTLENLFVSYCFQDHLDGEDLTDELLKSIKALQLDKKLQSLIFTDEIERLIHIVGNTTDICGDDVTGTRAMDLPEAFLQLYRETAAAMYSALDLNIPLNSDVIATMFESWKLVYRYFWGSFLLLMACFLVVMIMIRTTKVDAFDYMAFFNRSLSILIGFAIVMISVDKDLVYKAMETPVMLPVAVVLIYLIVLLDRLGAWMANRSNKRSGDPLIGRGHKGGDGHGPGGDGHGYSFDQRQQDDAKQNLIASSTVTSLTPHFEHRVSYNPLGANMMPTFPGADSPSLGYDSPRLGEEDPQPTPPPGGDIPMNTYSGSAGSGYMPVRNRAYEGHGYQ